MDRLSSSGLGVDKDYKMAALLGKAAYLQGSESALRTIAACYQNNEALAKDEEAKDYWELKAMGKGRGGRQRVGEDGSVRHQASLDRIRSSASPEAFI